MVPHAGRILEMFSPAGFEAFFRDPRWDEPKRIDRSRGSESNRREVRRNLRGLVSIRELRHGETRSRLEPLMSGVRTVHHVAAHRGQNVDHDRWCNGMLLDYDELDRLWRMLLIQTPHLTDRCLLPTRVDRQRARSP